MRNFTPSAVVAIVLAFGLNACTEKKETVIQPVPVPVPAPPASAPVPGPPGPSGPPGPEGAKGEPGKPGGDTVIIVPAPEPEKTEKK